MLHNSYVYPYEIISKFDQPQYVVYIEVYIRIEEGYKIEQQRRMK